MPKVKTGKTVVSDVNNPYQRKHGTEKKARKRRLRYSNFHLVVNTNQNCNPGSKQLEDTVKRLEQITDEWRQEDVIKDYIRHEPDPKENGRVGVWDDLDDVETQATVERGPRLNHPHVHMMIKIAHRSFIKMDCEKLAYLYTRGLGIFKNSQQRVYVHSQAHANREDFATVVKNYINKNVRDLGG